MNAGLIAVMIPAMKTLQAEEAAENFTKFLGRVHAHQESFTIVKEGVPCAYLLPARLSKCDSHEFAEDVARAELTAEDRHTLASAVRKGRKVLKPLKNPWG